MRVMRRSIERSTLVVAVVFALALGVLSWSAPASAAPADTISVTVKVGTSGPRTDGCVRAYPDGETTPVLTQCVAGLGGVYALAGLVPGDAYQIELLEFAGAGLNQWWGSVDSQGTANWTRPGSAVTATLTEARTLSGVVIDPSGDPVVGATVRARRAERIVGEAVTGPDGSYSYETASANLTVEVEPASPELGAAMKVVDPRVPEQLVTDFQLQNAGQIAGTLSVPSDYPSSQVCIIANPYSSSQGAPRVTCGEPGAPYLLESVTPGLYTFCITDNPAGWYCYSSPRNGFFYDTYGVPRGIGPSHLTTPVTEGETAHVTPVWGGTVRVTVTLDNGEAPIGGCLRMSQGATVITEDCEPDGNVFEINPGFDFYEYYYTVRLEDFANAKDAQVNGPIRVSAGDVVEKSMTLESTGSSTIDLVLTRDTGGAVNDACVMLYLREPTLGKQQEVCNGPDGHYVFDHVSSGTHYLVVEHPDTFEDYTTFSGDFVVDDPEDIAIEAVMPTSIAVHGTVRNAEGEPVGPGLIDVVSDDDSTQSIPVSATGAFAVSLPLGTKDYRLLARGFTGYGAAWLPGPATDAPQLRYGRDSTDESVDIAADIVLPAQTTLTGVLKVPPGWPAGETCIAAFQTGAWDAVVGSTCGEPGAPFTLGGLAGGEYTLCLYQGGEASRCRMAADEGHQWLHSPSSGSQIAKYAVLPGATTVVDYSFGARFVAHAYLAGAPLANGCFVVSAAGTPLGEDCTPEGGMFEVHVASDAGPGGFQLTLRDMDRAYDSHQTFSLVAGGMTQVWWPTLTERSRLVGTVSVPAGHEDADVCVEAIERSGASYEMCTDPGVHTYKMWVPDGDYAVRLSSSDSLLATEWHANASGASTATRVIVSRDGGANGRDVRVDAELGLGASLSGTVTQSDGTPAVGGCAFAYNLDGDFLGIDCVEAGGSFEITGLPPGPVNLLMAGFPRLALQWYPVADRVSAAESITLVAGEDTRIDMQLGLGGAVEGLVTLGGAPATGGCVQAVDTDLGEVVRTGCVEPDGTYSVDSLPAGTYALFFTGFDGAANEWSGGKVLPSGAQHLTIDAGQTVTFNAELVPGGSISGYVGYSDLAPGETAEVSLYTTSGDWVMTTRADASRMYRIDHLLPGNYLVQFGNFSTYWGEWYRTSIGGAPKVVSIASSGSGMHHSGIDSNFRADLDYGAATVVGTLNVPSTFKSSNVCVIALYGTQAGPVFCGPRRASFALDLVAEDPTAVSFVFLDGVISKSTDYYSFKGRKARLAANPKQTTWVEYTFPGPDVYYVPVYWFKDVDVRVLGFENILWMGDSGISEGYDDGSYKPDVQVIRKHMALFMWRFAGRPDPAPVTRSPYSDVKLTDPGANAMVWMSQEGIASGSKYRPNDKMTRKEMAVFLYKLAGSPAFTPPTKSPFRDVKTSDPAYKAIAWMSAKKITGGYSDGTFKPSNGVTRKHMATFMRHYLDYVGDPAEQY